MAQGLEGRGLTLLSSRLEGEASPIVTFAANVGGQGDSTFVATDSALALTAALAKRDIFVAARGGGVRVSPHFYNSEDEVRGLLTAVDEIVHTEGAGG